MSNLTGRERVLDPLRHELCLNYDSNQLITAVSRLITLLVCVMLLLLSAFITQASLYVKFIET